MNVLTEIHHEGVLVPGKFGTHLSGHEQVVFKPNRGLVTQGIRYTPRVENKKNAPRHWSHPLRLPSLAGDDA